MSRLRPGPWDHGMLLAVFYARHLSGCRICREATDAAGLCIGARGLDVAFLAAIYGGVL